MQTTLLSAVTGTGAGTAVQIERHEYTVLIIPTGVTTGATIAFQARSNDGTTWVNIDSRNVTSNNPVILNYNGPLNWIRANVTAYTDGTYTVEVIAL
jgi:hypothetical protein